MSNEFVPVTGGCLCQAVRYEVDANIGEAFYCHCSYEVDANIGEAFYCHCKTCQKTSGAPAAVGVFVKLETLKFTEEDPKIFQSSPFASRSFCQHCGSRIAWVSAEKAEWTAVFVGSLDHPERVVPTEDDPDYVKLWANAGMTCDGKPL